jgi:hypothetical protein
MKAIKGQWVNIHRCIFTSEQRAPQVPEDTKKVPLEMWVKGFLLDDEAEIGESVKIKTITGREESGDLFEINPTYRHSFGEFVPELLQVGIQLREILFGGEDHER